MGGRNQRHIAQQSLSSRRTARLCARGPESCYRRRVGHWIRRAPGILAGGCAEISALFPRSERTAAECTSRRKIIFASARRRRYISSELADVSFEQIPGALSNRVFPAGVIR